MITQEIFGFTFSDIFNSSLVELNGRIETFLNETPNGQLTTKIKEFELVLSEWSQFQIQQNNNPKVVKFRGNSNKLNDKFIEGRLEWVKTKLKEHHHQPKVNNSSLVKLNWNGSKKQLYDILSQLSTMTNHKNERLLDNTREELTNFLIQSVNGFEDTQPTTVRGELSKIATNPPISTKRIIIEYSNEEK